MFTLVNMIKRDLRIKDLNTIMSGKLKECLCTKQEWVNKSNKSIDEVKKDVTAFSNILKSKLCKTINN